MRSKFSLIFILLIISSVVAKRVEYECRSLQVKSLSCQLPSTHHLNSRNPIIWFKNFNQSSFNEMTTVEFYKYEVSSYMPSRIGQTFPKITYLMFRRSSVQYVMRRNFVHMKQLLKLNLNYNLIEELPHDVFHDLPELEYLDLRENMIYELHPDLLINLTKLKYFNMESNNIEVLNEGSFRNNPLIEEILLGSNEILNIDVDFSLLAHVKIIYLSNNFDMCNFNLEIYESEPRETKKLLKNLFQTKVEEFCRYLVL